MWVRGHGATAAEPGYLRSRSAAVTWFSSGKTGLGEAAGCKPRQQNVGHACSGPTGTNVQRLGTVTSSSSSDQSSVMSLVSSSAPSDTRTV